MSRNNEVKNASGAPYPQSKVITKEMLKASPAIGVLPRDMAREVNVITPWQVTLRIRRMNKRLDRQIGQKVAEKHGLHWALTSFAEAASELTKEEISIES